MMTSAATPHSSPPEGFFEMVTLVTLCTQGDGTSVIASVRAPSFTTPTRRAGQ
jgi:hypothetical protein